ncbi:hypothetical protein SpCBS45565_g00416 [Spizellomyces sp. 'palustris']|nr:hypothetical protein SpCBS45565_g00416 [Spizellomyces sp. 'palustris']
MSLALKDRFRCAACRELLFEPLTLPCGYSVCCRCFRSHTGHSTGRSRAAQEETAKPVTDSHETPDTTPISSPSSPTTTFYVCPARPCRQKHPYRQERPDVILLHILHTYFPFETEALQLVKQGEERLRSWLKDKDGFEIQLAFEGVEDNELGMRCHDSANTASDSEFVDGRTPSGRCLKSMQRAFEKRGQISNVIATSFTPAIERVPTLQLPYLLRAEALSEMFCFNAALEDAQRARQINSSNCRGMVAEKLIIWRKGIAEQAAECLSDVKDRADDSSAEQSRTSPSDYTALDSSLSSDDLECNLCLSLLHDPVTCPCGHTYCRTCILSSLDKHSRQCPLCRIPLPPIGYFLSRPANRILDRLARDLFLGEWNARAPGAENKLKKFGHMDDVPIFVCSLVFPGAAQAFHIFEPRYRVMIQRCMATNKRFGICLPNRHPTLTSSAPYVNHGTLVEIRHVEPIPSREPPVQTPEGPLPRFLIEVIGIHRFRVLDRSVDPTGYNVASMERVEDILPEDDSSISLSLRRTIPEQLNILTQRIQSFTQDLLTSLPQQARTTFQNQHGQPPSDWSDLCYWVAGFLPLSPYRLYELLSLNSVLARLEKVCEWIDEVVGKGA